MCGLHAMLVIHCQHTDTKRSVIFGVEYMAENIQTMQGMISTIDLMTAPLQRQVNSTSIDASSLGDMICDSMTRSKNDGQVGCQMSGSQQWKVIDSASAAVNTPVLHLREAASIFLARHPTYSVTSNFPFAGNVANCQTFTNCMWQTLTGALPGWGVGASFSW
jgi:hypothetical protein